MAGNVQCQTELGPGHINLINVYEAILTPDHLGIVMEYAAGGALTAHVAERWGAAKPGGLILTEDEARYFFRVSHAHFAGLAGSCKPSSVAFALRL